MYRGEITFASGFFLGSHILDRLWLSLFNDLHILAEATEAKLDILNISRLAKSFRCTEAKFFTSPSVFLKVIHYFSSFL